MYLISKITDEEDHQKDAVMGCYKAILIVFSSMIVTSWQTANQHLI
jgi:hypothetical protein